MTEKKPGQQISLMLPISTTRPGGLKQAHTQTQGCTDSQLDLAQRRDVLIEQLQKSGYVKPRSR